MTTQLKEEHKVKLPAKKWYIIQTYSNQEKKVKEDLETRIKTQGLQYLFDRVFVPFVKKIEITEKKGVKVEKIKEENPYPGYVFVKMQITDKSWFIVRNTPSVTGFLGSSGNKTLPVPVLRKEMEAILRKYDDKRVIKTYDHYIGQNVIIKEGPFENSTGKIEAVNNEKAIASVGIDMFGRTTTIEVEISALKLK